MLQRLPTGFTLPIDIWFHIMTHLGEIRPSTPRLYTICKAFADIYPSTVLSVKPMRICKLHKYNNLRTLDIYNCDVSMSDLTKLSNLTDLSLSVYGAQYDFIAHSVHIDVFKHLSNLSALGLNSSIIREPDIPYLPVVTKLSMQSCSGSVGKYIASLAQLRHLEVSSPLVRDEHICRLMHLTHLNVSASRSLTISAISHLTNLAYLNISSTAISSYHNDLLNCHRLTNLTYLNISNNNGQHDLKFPKLRTLIISSNYGIENMHLYNCTNLTHLTIGPKITYNMLVSLTLLRTITLSPCSDIKLRNIKTINEKRLYNAYKDRLGVATSHIMPAYTYSSKPRGNKRVRPNKSQIRVDIQANIIKRIFNGNAAAFNAANEQILIKVIK